MDWDGQDCRGRPAPYSKGVPRPDPRIRTMITGDYHDEHDRWGKGRNVPIKGIVLAPHHTPRLGSPRMEKIARVVGEKQSDFSTHRQKSFSPRLLRPK